MAHVNPSQRAPDKAHRAWVATKKDGEVITAHCTCMAGLGEGCSHSAAILFKIEYAVRLGYTSVTSNLCSWNQVFNKKQEPSRIINIDFRQSKRDREDVGILEKPDDERRNKVSKTVPKPSSAEQLSFLTTLKKLAPEAVVLEAFFPLERRPNESHIKSLPPTLMTLYRPCYKTLSKDELAVECQRIFDGEELAITPSQSQYLFTSTMLQSQSSIWFDHRIGRLTASKFGEVCKTSITNPSKSLVESILKKKEALKVPAIKWGIEHESDAREAYIKHMENNHQCFEVETAGLYVNPLSPHLGASPDGLVSCSCCYGLGLLEIKCPFSIKDGDPTGATFYEANGEAGGVQLSQKHNYYYQVQGQLLILEREYCDFVCWTQAGIHIERIFYDDELVSTMIPKLDTFFVKVILPRILCGGTVTGGSCSKKDDNKDDEVFCFCRKGERGKMIFCDSLTCKYGWFHFDCLDLDDDFEADEWYCPDCEAQRAQLL